MSNEAFLSGVFVGCAAATVFFTHFVKQSVLRELANIATVISGLAFVWSIPQVYNIATIANWNTEYTTLQMWATMFVGGGALAIAIGARGLGIAAFLLGTLAIFASRAGYQAFLSETGPALSAEQTGFWGFQVVVLVIALAAFVGFALKQRAPKIR
ncbi:DMSO reductase anchor subunit (DmsC) [Providencia rustigianii]|nr:DMSO reductase anchor subunit (DmsC) [Providencia rustigianii]